jgi:hypothetical protein
MSHNAPPVRASFPSTTVARSIRPIKARQVSALPTRSNRSGGLVGRTATSASVGRHHHGATARRSGADDLCSRSGAFRVSGECASAASLKEWDRVKVMVGSMCRLRAVVACVRARVVGGAGVRAGRRPPGGARPRRRRATAQTLHESPRRTAQAPATSSRQRRQIRACVRQVVPGRSVARRGTR